MLDNHIKYIDVCDCNAAKYVKEQGTAWLTITTQKILLSKSEDTVFNQQETWPSNQYLFPHGLKQKSGILKVGLQVLCYLSQMLGFIYCWLSSQSSGGRVFLWPLQCVRFSLHIFPSTQNLLALCEVLVGMTERESGVLHLLRKMRKHSRGRSREDINC